MRDKVLDFLKKASGYISGEEISRRLQVSRQALWKHIQELKEAGYDIVAVPHLGYRLDSSPDRLFPAELSHGLNTKILGKKIHYFEKLPSTMDAAWQLGLEGAPEGTIILAESQSRGRGRFGREWLSPKHKGIYFSLILRPKITPGSSPILTLLTAVSIVEAIKNSCGIDARIKWPNDILVHGKKLGGILTEINAEMDLVHFVVIGVGLNVNNDKKALLPAATSLKEQKKEELQRCIILQEILRRIEYNYLLLQQRHASLILEKWRSLNVTIGRRVKVAFGNSHMEGEAVDIDSDGALLVRNDSGLSERVTAGDITHCRPTVN